MTLPGAHNRFGLYNRGSRGMSKLPLHTTRIASIQRLQHWLTRGQGFAADCPPPPVPSLLQTWGEGQRSCPSITLVRRKNLHLPRLRASRSIRPFSPPNRVAFRRRSEERRVG